MICKNCNETVQDGLALCPQCGAKLEDVSEPEASAVTTESAAGTEKAADTAETVQPETKAEDSLVVKEEKAPIEPTQAAAKPQKERRKEKPAQTEAAPKTMEYGKMVVTDQKKSNKTALGIVIGIIALIVLLLVTGVALYFTGVIKLPFGNAPLAPQSAMSVVNNSANNSIFFQVEGQAYCNMVVAAEGETGIYKVASDGSTTESFAPGVFYQTVPVGQYIFVNRYRVGETNEETGETATAYGGPLQMYDTTLDYGDDAVQPQEVFAGNAYGLRAYENYCYFSEFNDETMTCNGINRYDPAKGEVENLFTGEIQDFTVFKDTLVYFTYNAETSKCDLFALDIAGGGEPKALGSYSMLTAVFQMTDEYIFFSRFDDNQENVIITRMDYAGENVTDVITLPFDQTLYNLQFNVDEDGIMFGTMNVDSESGASTASLKQYDLDGNEIADIFSDPWYRVTKLDGNYFYIKIDVMTNESAYAMRQGKNVGQEIFLFKKEGMDTPSEAPDATESDVSATDSSSTVSLDPVPDDVLHEDYDPEVQLKAPKKGDEIAKITTSEGEITLRFFEKQAPKTVENFKGLAKKGYYDGLTFHRVMNGFMIQGGDPKGDGSGGESFWGEPFEDEFNKDLLNLRGALSMANSGANTNGSQFFINQAKPEVMMDWDQWIEQQDSYDQMYGARDPYQPKRIPKSVKEQYTKIGGNPTLDGAYRTEGGHTVFGQVLTGLDIVDKIAALEDAEGEEQGKPSKTITIEKVEIVKYEG